MAELIELNIETFRKAVYVTSGIAGHMNLPLSGVRYDGGVLGFGTLTESLSRVIYNIQNNVIFYYPEEITEQQRYVLHGLAQEHDITMEELYLDLEEEVLEEA